MYSKQGHCPSLQTRKKNSLISRYKENLRNISVKVEEFFFSREERVMITNAKQKQKQKHVKVVHMSSEMIIHYKYTVYMYFQ